MLRWRLSWVMVFVSLWVVVPARAQPQPIYVVNKTADTNDGICDSDCSLREALIAANGDAGRDIIKFNIPGAGVHTISPASALPPPLS